MTDLAAESCIEMIIRPKDRDLGEFTVRRVLPAIKRRMVGPFVFFDHMGPAVFPPGKGIAVRPHPHIGLATITYLFEGQIMHRDNLGYEQAIEAGAVNLMTAGRGITHSERAGDDLEETSRLHGIQSWMALPIAEEEREPAFVHYPAAELPELDVDGCTIRIIMGECFGQCSSVTTYSETLYMECVMPAGRQITIPGDAPELAAYVVSGEVSVAGENFGDGVMLVAKPGEALRLAANQDARVMILGGEPLGERHVWWNFVSSSRERIERAKDDWREGRFESVPGDDEFIPLPDR
ncbi:MAG: pirin family protein [Gammaproteobacteria bacterium]|nr:pirin family protein [Gammaproteobacteria bacterium]